MNNFQMISLQFDERGTAHQIPDTLIRTHRELHSRHLSVSRIKNVSLCSNIWAQLYNRLNGHELQSLLTCGSLRCGPFDNAAAEAACDDRHSMSGVWSRVEPTSSGVAYACDRLPSAIRPFYKYFIYHSTWLKQLKVIKISTTGCINT